MGYSTKVEVGYYFDIQPQIIKTTEQFRKCSGCGKIYTKSEKFCASCGNAIVNKWVECDKTIDHFFEFIEGHKTLSKFSEIAFTPEYRPNHGFHAINIHTVAYDEKCDMEDGTWLIEDLTQKSLLDEAKTEIEDFMKEFKKIYGEHSISLKYGMFAYTF